MTDEDLCQCMQLWPFRTL